MERLSTELHILEKYYILFNDNQREVIMVWRVDNTRGTAVV